MDVDVMRVTLPTKATGSTREFTADPNRLLTVREVCILLQIEPVTWRAYVSRGQAPAPDDPDSDAHPNRRRPRWRLSTVREYKQGRTYRAKR